MAAGNVQVEAKVNNGVLEIHIPKTEDKGSTSVRVQGVGPGSDTTTSDADRGRTGTAGRHAHLTASVMACLKRRSVWQMQNLPMHFEGTTDAPEPQHAVRHHRTGHVWCCAVVL